MWRKCKSATVQNGRVKLGDRASVWGIDDCGQDTLLTGTVARIWRYDNRRIGTLICIEIVDENGEFLWEEQAHEFSKVLEG